MIIDSCLLLIAWEADLRRQLMPSIILSSLSITKEKKIFGLRPSAEATSVTIEMPDPLLSELCTIWSVIYSSVSMLEADSLKAIFICTSIAVLAVLSAPVRFHAPNVTSSGLNAMASVIRLYISSVVTLSRQKESITTTIT